MSVSGLRNVVVCQCESLIPSASFESHFNMLVNLFGLVVLYIFGLHMLLLTVNHLK